MSLPVSDESNTLNSPPLCDKVATAQMTRQRLSTADLPGHAIEMTANIIIITTKMLTLFTTSSGSVDRRQEVAGRKWTPEEWGVRKPVTI